MYLADFYKNICLFMLFIRDHENFMGHSKTSRAFIRLIDLYFLNMTRKRSISCPVILISPSPLKTFIFETRVIHLGRLYHHNKTYNSDSGVVYYYRCANESCKGKLKISVVSNLFTVLKSHSCNRIDLNAQAMLQLVTKSEVEAYIKEKVEFLAAAPSMAPQDIYEAILLSLGSKCRDSTYPLPLKSDIKALVKNFRTSDILDIDKIKNPPLSNTVSGHPF
jgi:hypothetical protein